MATTSMDETFVAPVTEFSTDIIIDAVIAPKISFVTHQNAVPVLRELRLVNLTDVPLENLVLTMEADPPVFARREWRIDRLGAGGEVQIAQRDLPLNAGLLLQLAEAVTATITMRVRREGPEGSVVSERNTSIELLARNEWGGAGAMPELLAAFVLPNDPAVDRVLKAASDVLLRSGRPDGLDGYQSRSRTRVHELASAIWSAVSGLRLTYAEPPASFELQGQKVRSPSQVVDRGLATCLDTALLFAAALEQIGLYPILVLTEGHAFAGVWLQPQEFATLLVPDAASLRKRIALDELIVFETTLATGSSPSPFSRAIDKGKRQIDEEHEDKFVAALDLRRARMQRIRPLAMTEQAEGSAPASPGDPETEATGVVLEAAPPLPDFDLAEQGAAPTNAEGRLDRWQRKLLDLTTRNRLLNVKPGATAIRLLCPDPAQLEDQLADGVSFRIVGMPGLEGAAGRDAGLHAQRTGEVLDEAYARDALDRGELLSPSPPDKLDGQLIELYRKARLDLAEGGANTLFLAVGFLSWRKSATDAKSYRAPLVLLPVKLERRSVRSGVKLSIHEEEPRFNLTLLQMLRQDFELEIPELAGTLPTDASGIDVPRILNLVRRAVRDLAGFEVVEDVVLGAFSFAKYLMWKDLVDRTDALKANRVVRHLLETPRDPYECDMVPPRPEALDAEVSPGELFTPLPADSSQLAAVVGSARGCDFVLDGPPGTGKSQTIANMIAHNLALGRKVLFVAEKRAALEVVHRRLVAHGLGPFCLELHSNKASKADVLRQLDAAWTAAEAEPGEVWERRASELKLSRDRLNRLVAALHRRHSNGLTLYGAIGRVVRDDSADAVRLDWPPGAHHDEGQLEVLREIARKLDLNRPAAAGERARSFSHVGRTEWSNAWQAELLSSAAALGTAARDATGARARFVAALGAEPDGNAHGLAATAELAGALLTASGLDMAFAFQPDAARAIAHAREAAPLVETYRSDALSLSSGMDEHAVRAAALDILDADWAAATTSFWPLSFFKRRAIARRLGTGPTVDPANDLPKLRVMQNLLARIDDLAASAAGTPGWRGVETNTAALSNALDVGDRLRTALVRTAETPEQLVALRSGVKRLVLDANELLAVEGAVGRAAEEFSRTYAHFKDALDGFERVAASPCAIDADDLLAEAQTIAADLAARAPQLNAWAAWRRARLAAHDAGLQVIVAAVEAGGLAEGGAEPAFDLAYARWWAEAAIDAEPVVRDFNIAEQADAIQRFRDLDRDFAQLTQAYIRAKLSGAIPPKDAKSQPPGFGALAHQLKLQKRHKPVSQAASG